MLLFQEKCHMHYVLIIVSVKKSVHDLLVIHCILGETEDDISTDSANKRHTLRTHNVASLSSDESGM